MTGLGEIFQHGPWFILVATRIAGLFLTAPMFSTSTIPRQARIFIILAFAAITYPLIPLDHIESTPTNLLMLAPLAAGELLIGVSLGLFALVPFVCAQLAGLMMSQQMGLALADVINPGLDINGSNFGQLLYYLTFVIYAGLGGMELLFISVGYSFSTIPVGAATLTLAPLELFTAMLDAGFVLSIRVALPVLTIIFIETIAVGFIMKTVPSLNIMSFGFPIRIMVGAVMFLTALSAFAPIIREFVHEILFAIEDWPRTLIQSAGAF